MQFAELTNVSRDMIRESFLIHKHILGQSEDVNLANALAADEAFAERLVVPRLERSMLISAMDGVPIPEPRDWAELARLPICLLHQAIQNRRILDARLVE